MAADIEPEALVFHRAGDAPNKRRIGLQHRHPPPRPAEQVRRGEPSRSAPQNGHIGLRIGFVRHVTQVWTFCQKGAALVDSDRTRHKRATTAIAGGERTDRRLQSGGASEQRIIASSFRKAPPQTAVRFQSSAGSCPPAPPPPTIHSARIQPFSAGNRGLFGGKCSANRSPAHPLAKRMLNSPAR